jgi:uncharacterized membrane protein YfhO
MLLFKFPSFPDVKFALLDSKFASCQPILSSAAVILLLLASCYRGRYTLLMAPKLIMILFLATAADVTALQRQKQVDTASLSATLIQICLYMGRQ